MKELYLDPMKANISMNLRHFSPYIVLFAAISVLAACAAGNAAKRMPTENSLLWEITGKGLEKPSYLFGTIHAIGESDFFLREEVKNTFANAERLVMEVKIDEPGLQASMREKMIMSDGQSLDQLLSAAEYEKLKAFMREKAGMPELMYNKVKPMFVQSFIYPSMIGEPMKSYETVFSEMATEAEMDIMGLETVDEQLSYVDQISLEDQLEMLMQGVDDFDGQLGEWKQMVSLYVSEDIAGLSGLISEESKEYKKFEKKLLGERNKNWISRIGTHVRAEPSFIAVGAGHLGGKNGVISLLRKEGYELRALK